MCYQDGTRRPELCESCEILAARNEYKERAEAELEKRFDETGRGRNYNFDFLNRCVIDALQFEKLPRPALTKTAAEMTDIIEGERRRIVRVRNWNRANTPANGS